MKDGKKKSYIPKDQEFYEKPATVVVNLADGPLRDIVMHTIEKNGFKVYEASALPDLVAVPALLVVVDPALIDEGDWTELCGWYEEMMDPEMKVLLVRENPHRSSPPQKNLVRHPKEIDEKFLTLLLLSVKKTRKRREAVFKQKERQIVRLMYMIHRLDNGETVRLREVAREFNVSLRTVQRDIDVLDMAGFLLDATDTPGEYRFFKGFKSYQSYYGNE